MEARDPVTNYEMNKPRPQAECSKAIDAFWEDVAAARVKHRISDIVLTLEAQTDDGPIIMTGAMGQQIRAESLAAYALGKFQAERQQTIAKIVASAGAIHRAPEAK